MLATSPLADVVSARNVVPTRSSLTSSHVPQVPIPANSTIRYSPPRSEIKEPLASPFLGSPFPGAPSSITQSQVYNPEVTYNSSFTQSVQNRMPQTTYITQTTERYTSKPGDMPSALNASTAAPAALRVGPHQSEKLVGPNPLYSQYVSMPTQASVGQAPSYLANSAPLAQVDPFAYRNQSPPPLITTASAGHMRPSETPLAFTTVTYAKNGSVAGGTVTSPYQTSHHASVVQSISHSQKHVKHQGPRFVKKQRGACAGCNEKANAAFDSNGGNLGWLNCGCCDRPQRVPVAIDYSPQAHMN